MMRVLHRRRSVFLLAIVVTLGPHRAAAQQQTNPTAAAIEAFNKQVTAYITLQKKEASGVAAMKPTATPAEVVAREKALADRIRTARTGAKQGDVFVPAVVPLFKKTFSDYFKRRTGREKRLMFDEVPNFTPQVGLTYPATAAKATFPPRLSLELPQLPEQLEYRLVGTSLVLRDTEANIIVDFIPNVLPPSSNPGSPK